MKMVLRGLVTAMFAIFIMTLGIFASSQTSAASSSAATNQSSDGKIWQINANAHLLKMDDTAAWVYVQSPDKMKIAAGDRVRPLQRIPLTPNVVVSDSGNNATAIDQIVPGQTVQVKFTYRFVGSSRIAMPVECKSIVLSDTRLKAKSTKSISELKENTAVATILEIDKNKVTVFVEGGKLLANQTPYEITGSAVLNVSSASVKDVDGTNSALSRLKKYDRVLLGLNNHTWQETAPPTYTGGDAVSIQVLGVGENIILPPKAD